MSQREHRVSVDGGKYTFVIPADDYRVGILRHGKPWHEQSEASHALHAIMCELDAARVVIEAVRDGVRRGSVSEHDRIGKSLALHDSLVDDRERPSGWAVSRQGCDCAGGDHGGHDLDCSLPTHKDR